MRRFARWWNRMSECVVGVAVLEVVPLEVRLVLVIVLTVSTVFGVMELTVWAWLR